MKKYIYEIEQVGPVAWEPGRYAVVL